MSYRAAFKQFLPHRCGPCIVSALSPNGQFLVTSGGDGVASLVDFESGRVIGCLDFGYDRRATCIRWINNSRFITGNVVGEILSIQLTLGGFPVRQANAWICGCSCH